jgi:type I restriction enzyme S subunit
MANEWRTVRLGEFCSKIGSGATPRGGSKVYLEHGPFALVRSQNVRNDSFARDGLAHITAEQADGLANVELQPKDVLLNITGDSVARCCLVDEGILPGRVNQHVAIIRPRPDELDPVFLRYSLVSPEMQERMLSWAAAGGTRNALTKGMIEAFEVPCPPIREQRAIAHVLGTLDDKIECNRRLNRTLEGIVRALFKSWFIDFDPVIDNALAAGNPIPDELADRAALRQQAAEEHAKPLPDDLRALFPAEFTHTDTMGWIPKGWDVAPLSRTARLKAKTVNPGNSPDQVWVHFSIPAFDDGRQPVHDKGETIKSGKYLVPPCCVLASKLNPQFPRVWLPDVSDPAVSICSTEFMPFVPKTESELPFLYAFLSSEAAQTEITNRVTGSTGSRQRVKPKEIAEMPVLVPPQALRQRFSLTTSRHLDRLLNNTRSIAKLSALRDTLLPRLLSGEVTVPVAVTLTEEAGQ